MAVTSIQLYQVFQKLFKTEEPTKDQVIQQGVQEVDFDSADMDSNEYLTLDEGFNSYTVSEFLYETAVSAFGTEIVNSGSDSDDNKNSSKSKTGFGDLTKRAF